ncbi:hypothetical protein Poli38472_006313 [Pythium oligandrum]|uniref:Bifunctional lysine-specific demethylase and histidyl-hydroxylase n=1 Tax=Pythium oligandrum TaxID=41045 RepID=A0A8K1CSN5_PYTOL|nr:hypothetical protein Poli38472_006313 [Pythium oligandrum]|eukprot:TMW68845.1 hypothetical protein Poli38472_006313 [Pythium oligandrum]
MSRSKQAGRRGKSKRAEAEAAPERVTKKAKKLDAAKSDEVASSSDAAREVVAKLLGETTLDQFMTDYFEKQPLLVRSEGNHKLFDKGLFSRQKLLETVGSQELEFGKDMTVVRYVDNERENYLPDNGKLGVKKSQLSGLLNKGYSCQFYQPQRYVDGLFQLNSSFEQVFGCLAGASAYLTPPASQALPPHHDDVEVFIIQTEGRKKWKLYRPITELAGEHSSDLSSDLTGDIWMEFTLEEGDMLYFPRGVIHQACTDEKQFSTHVTISVYQHNSWANFLEVALPRMVRRAFDSDVSFRRGLPVQYLSYMGTQFDPESATAKKFVAECKALVGKLSSWVDPSDLHKAADDAALDFIASRLPPATAEDGQTAGFLLESDSKIRFRDRSYVRLVLGEDEEKETVISVYHSMRNCRLHHMGMCSCILNGEEEDEDDEDDGEENDKDEEDDREEKDKDDEDDEGSDEHDEEDMGDMPIPPQAQSIVFPESLVSPLMRLYSSYPAATPISELVQAGEDETEVRGMLLRLWSEGLLETSD